MTLKEQLKYNFSLPWYKFLRRLALWGFVKAYEGEFLRLRNFTPLFCRTLVQRERIRAEVSARAEIMLLKHIHEQEIMLAMGKGWDACAKYMESLIGTRPGNN